MNAPLLTNPFAALRAALRRRMNKWVFQLRPAEVGEVFLNQRRVFIVPTGAGFAFALLLVLLFIGAVNYNLSLGFAFTFLVAGCALIDMHLTFRNLAHLYLSPGRAQPVFCGETAQFELHLTNRRKHDRYALWLGFIGEGLPELDHPADVAANATQNVVLSTQATQRGWLAAPRIRLHTRFPLGLFHAWSYWQPALNVLVYPQPELVAPPLPMNERGDDSGTGAAGHDDFAGIRAYQPGDALKHLAWRQIARVDLDAGGALVTKHFEGGAASELCLSLAALPYTMDLESKLSRLTRWVLDAEGQGLPYAFRLGGLDLPAAIGPAHQAACLTALALYQAAT
jgi:uncharacterized protein (DUF58 family)